MSGKTPEDHGGGRCEEGAKREGEPAVTRRLCIDDYEWMIRARKAFLAADHSGDLEAARAAEILAGDRRLDGPLFMEWEVRPLFDRALVRALRILLDRVEEDLALGGTPPSEIPEAAARLRKEIQETIERLAGKRGLDPGVRRSGN